MVTNFVNQPANLEMTRFCDCCFLNKKYAVNFIANVRPIAHFGRNHEDFDVGEIWNLTKWMLFMSKHAQTSAVSEGLGS